MGGAQVKRRGMTRIGRNKVAASGEKHLRELICD